MRAPSPRPTGRAEPGVVVAVGLGLSANIFGDNLFIFFSVGIPINDLILIYLYVLLWQELFSNLVAILGKSTTALWNSHVALLRFSHFFLHSNSQSSPININLSLSEHHTKKHTSHLLSSFYTHFSHFLGNYYAVSSKSLASSAWVQRLTT